MLKGFKEFMLRGNVVDLAVAVVIGGAFGAIVTALVKDLVTPLIAAFVGTPDFSAIAFTINSSKFLVGDFINALVSFLLIGSAVYFFFRRRAGQCVDGADEARRGPARSDDEEVRGLLQRHPDRGEALLVLHEPAEVGPISTRPIFG